MTNIIITSTVHSKHIREGSGYPFYCFNRIAKQTRFLAFVLNNMKSAC